MGRSLTNNKVPRGREFAEIVEPPKEVREFYASALRHLGVPAQGDDDSRP